MGLKKFTDNKSVLNLWKKEIKKDYDVKLKNMNDVYYFLIKLLAEDDIDAVITMLANNQQLVTDSIEEHYAFSVFIDDR